MDERAAAARHARLGRIAMAADRLAGEDRERFLAAECAGDESLLRDVRGVLGSTDGVADGDAPASLPGRFGPWRVVREVGSGGMGVVYEAVDERDGSRVALKAIHPHLLGMRRAEERFEREGEAGSRLVHPNVVRTIAARRERDDSGRVRPVLVTEFVEGRTLRELLESLGRAPESLVREIGRGVAAGAAAIHAAGLVHRDIKPENVMLTTDGRVRIMDLGVALATSGDGRLTREGEFVGSLDYAAPEQCDGRGAGPAADLYSIGVVLHELASGTNPFARDSALATVAAHASFRAPDLGSATPPSSRFLAAVVGALLEKDPALRVPSADDLWRILDEGEEGAWWRERVRASVAQPAAVPVARDAVFRGRVRELAALRAAFDDAADGRGSSVLVTAEGGHGKSRLLDALRESVAGRATFVYAAIPPTGGPSALFDAVLAAASAAGGAADPVAWLSSAAGMSPELAAIVAAHLRRERLPGGAAGLDADGSETALRRVLLALAESAPVVFAADDVQNAQGPTAALLASLVRRIGGGRVLVVLAARPDPQIAWTADLVTAGLVRPLPLPRLAAADVEEILAAALGSADLARRAARRVAARSGGVPLYVAAIAAMLRERLASVPPDRRGDAVDAAEVPLALRELLQGRLAALSPDERALADACAVQGAVFDADAAAAAAGMPVVRALQTLAAMERRTGIVRAEGRSFRFDHQLVQEEIVDAMPARLREELHLATARALEASGRAGPEELAMHYVSGSEPMRARPHVVPALDSFARRDEGDAALALAARALAVPGLLDARGRASVLVRAAEIHDLAGRRDAQRDAVLGAVEAAREARDTGLAGQAYYAAAVHLWAVGGDRDALPRFRAAVRLARRARDRSAEIRASAAASRALARMGRLDEARRRLDHATGIAVETGDREGELTARMGRAAVELSLGRTTDARPALHRALELARASGSLRTEGQVEWGLGVADIYEGNWPSARAHLTRARDIGRAIGVRTIEVNAVANLAVCLQAEGAWIEAIDAIAGARSIIDEIGEHTTQCILLLNIAMGHAVLGDTESEARALDAAESMAEAAGFRQAQARVRVQRGESRRSAGDLAGAVALYRDAITRFSALGDSAARADALLCLAAALRESGDIAGATAAADEAVADSERGGNPASQVAAKAARAALPGGDPDGARAALDAWGARGALSTRVTSRLDIWRGSGDAKDAAEARSILAGALARVPPDRLDGVRRTLLFRQVEAACAAAGLPPL